MIIGEKYFDTQHHTYVMGILNMTPDSFSDGGMYVQIQNAIAHAREMVSQGAALIDVGGESTRPGYVMISEEEEIARIIPVVEALKASLDVPISVDTYKPKVAKAALEAGADMINDIWGLRYPKDSDHKMAELIAQAGAACCLMHNRTDNQYTDFYKDLRSDLEESIFIAQNAGISSEKIMLDPGVGFAKNQEENLEAIRAVGELGELGYPVLLGTSRKSVIGNILEVPAKERMVGTVVTTVYGVEKHCGFVRVHDVKENYQAIQMAEALWNHTEDLK